MHGGGAGRLDFLHATDIDRIVAVLRGVHAERTLPCECDNPAVEGCRRHPEKWQSPAESVVREAVEIYGSCERVKTSLLSQPAKATFYGAQCPSYPNCKGGCGLGCTHEMETASSDPDFPDCATARERDLYFALMLLASAVAVRRQEWRRWRQAGTIVAPVVLKALRIETEPT